MDVKALASIVLLSALAASVQGLPDNTMVTCRTKVDCSDPTGKNITLRDCCLGDGNLAFNFNASCIPCVVIGWLNDSFTGKEQNENYIINAGYIKGADRARVNLVLEVKARSDTAKEGFNNDYTLLTTQVIAPYLLSPRQVQFNFHDDGIALESNETLSFELILNNRTKNQLMIQEGLIIKNILQLTIMDSDRVQINFLENDYSTDEQQNNGSAGALDVAIVKSTQIASRVDLTITPVTVDEAVSSGGPLPVVIPNDNPFSPNKASKEDFNATPIIVTFEPDENRTPVTLKRVFIPVIDDLVDEAMEQVFILQLNTSNTRVDLSVRQATLCKILDNDDIVIGFVQPEYNYPEPPMFETFIGEGYMPQANESGPIFLEKVGDIRTEQRFRISIQVSGVTGVPGTQPAAVGVDYRIGAGAVDNVLIEMFPSQQRINFPFTLLHDESPEGTEAFEASSSSDITPVVLNNIIYQVPKYATSESFKCLVRIKDDDPIIIGFEKNYTVNESIGRLNVAVKVIKPPDNDELPTLVQVNVQTVSGTASGDIDYTSVFDQDVILFFNNDIRNNTFEVDITDDSFFESTENFMLVLSSVTSGVELVPGLATIDILDNDYIMIGFEHTSYAVDESAGRLTVVVKVISPPVGEDLPAIVSLNAVTVSGTAMDRVDYMSQNVNLTFDNVTRTASFDVDITNDDLFEVTEKFTLELMLVNNSTSRVVVNQGLATVDIQDDDDIVIGFDQSSYSVIESTGKRTVVVRVTSPPDDEELPATVSLDVLTVPGTATEGEDYISRDVTLVFDNDTRTVSFDVGITNDDVFEISENFTLELMLDSSTTDRVVIDPEEATIDILDTDAIIIGFDQSSYSVDESAGKLTVVVRVTNPPDDEELPATVSLNALTVPGTATGGGIDYTNQDIILIFNEDSRTASFDVVITDDTLAELTESFTLKLVLNSSTSDHVMIRPEEATINIEDDDIVQIYFSGDDFTANEADGVCDVTIVKSIGIAYRVVLTVTPLTIDDAFASSGPTPTNSSIPRDNPYSPNRASGEDFNNAVITITFEPDEIRSVKQVSIPIVNDAINEATEQVFVVQLATSNTTVNLSMRPASLCRITDNDPIRIGFEKSKYTYSEPISETNIDETDDNPIFLQKEGGVVTEQTFVITVQDSSDIPSDLNIRPATSGEDYVLPEPSVYIMLPGQQKINVPFTLFTEHLPEATEGFKISSSPDTTPRTIGNITYDVPTYSNPQSSSAETFVIIMDDDPIVIGFENTSYTISESIGTLDVVVRVTNPPDDEELPASVSLNVLTVPGTATGGVDYEELDADNFTSLLIFDNIDRMDTISVTIIDDEVRGESTENFTLLLQLSSVGPLNVKLDPSTATINIEDDRIIIPVNDTIIGDPLFSVPILVSEDDLKMIDLPPPPKLSLCYEVHGARDKIYNMITDECASVNAHYKDLTSSLNVIDRVGVRATDDKDQCKNIQVDVEGCEASIDGFPIDAYNFEGISVRKYNNRVRIMVPNCNELSLVMWVICETRTLDDPKDETNTITGDMIKLVVTRGLNFGHRKAHGLIGQFWNIPVSVKPYKGNDSFGNPVEQVFVVNITTNGASRGYAGHLYHMTWDRQMTPCLYVGNRQAGPIREIPYPNDYIIEGKYEKYAVSTLFTEDEDYDYSLFNEGKCVDLPTAGTTL